MRFLRTRAMQFGVDAAVITLALAAAYAVRFEGFPPRLYAKQFLLVLPYILLLRLSLSVAFGVHRLVWRYISFHDVIRIGMATASGTAVIVVMRFTVAPLFNALGFPINPTYATVPLGVLASELVLSSSGLIAVRALWRLLTEEHTRRSTSETAAAPAHRALLVGAGSAGVMVAREADKNPAVGFSIVGFLDDDPNKLGSVIHGHRVLGPTERLGEIAVKADADMAVITMASAPAAVIRRIVNLAEEATLKVQIIPGLHEILSGRVSISKIRNVAIEDLLGRAPVQLEEENISKFIAGKVVLVTGAGGSIGAEMCRQVARYAPKTLVLLDQAENPLFHIHRELLATDGSLPLEPVVCNVLDRERLQQVMAEHRPHVVIHAAAHKHVPLMELNPGEAVKNNVLGSRNAAELAKETGAEAFVMISTDKAVNPTSVMGATKRLAEMYVQALAGSSGTRFITVRFGNVLGSEGSVVPIFREQIARGGPVTVTHPEMKRYFMTIPEASQLVLQAASMGQGGEIFILDMGQPVKIVDLARDLIRLSGYQPDSDIEIELIGMRPGEKLYEEINLSEENATKTRHPRIWIGHCVSTDAKRLIERIAQLAAHTDGGAIRAQLAACVPEYKAQEGEGDVNPAASVGATQPGSSREERPLSGELALGLGGEPPS